VNKQAIVLPVITLQRPKIIHKECCKHCPSKPGTTPDPEVEDFLAATRDIQIASCFPCGWRPNALCKGYCDLMKVTSADL
jgi:hypothetical protein